MGSLGHLCDQWSCHWGERGVIIRAKNNQRNLSRTMISWLKQPIAQMSTRTVRMRFYAVAIALVAVSVPFLHLYMDDQLTPIEMTAHTLSVAFSTAIAIALFELMLWIYLKQKIRKIGVSVGLFWLFFTAIFVLTFIVMSVTHDFLPMTFDIWNKHIAHDIVAAPWKMLPVVFLIGYMLFQLIRRYQLTQELLDLKQLNEQLQAVKASTESRDSGVKDKQLCDTPKFVLSCKDGDIYLNPASVIRVESDENYCHVLVIPEEGQSRHRFMARITLNDVANKLPENIFLRVHRSHIVNFSFVSSLERQGRNYQLRLTNGDNVPVSRSRIKEIRQKVQSGALNQ